MIDKPIAAKIFLVLADDRSTGEEFISLSGCLYRQNLIFSEPRELRKNNNILELSVMFRDRVSFSSWMENTEIRNLWDLKFDQLLIDKPTTIQENDVIIEIDKVRNCVCDKSDFYILKGRTSSFIDELSCGNCSGQISYRKVPLEIPLEEWQTTYQRIYLNWLEGGLFEQEAY